MKVMLDLNVMLDVFQERHPYYHASASVISKVLNKEITGLLPSHAITTIQYITSKYSGKQKADETIDWMLTHFNMFGTQNMFNFSHHHKKCREKKYFKQ